MSLAPLVDVVRTDPAVGRALDLAREHGPDSALVDVTVAPGLRPALLAALSSARAGDGTVLAVTATGREAEDLVAALACFMPAERLADFPSWETLPHERLSPRSDTVGRRLAVLRRLAHPDAAEHGPLDVVVAPIRALLQPIAAGLGDLAPVSARAGQEYPLEQMVEDLAGAAYTRTDLVERRGEFAVRGGVLDIFPPTEQHPLRLEFFGDEIEEIRSFAVADQRSLDVVEGGLWAPPCRELLLTESVRERARQLAASLPGVADLLGKVAEGIAVEGMESFMPALVDGMETLLDVLPEQSRVVLLDPERIRSRAHDLVATSEEFLEASWSNAAAGNHVPVDLRGVLDQASYLTLAQVRGRSLTAGLPWWTFSSFGSAPLVDGEPAEGEEVADIPASSIDVDDAVLTLRVESSDIDGYRGDSESAVADLRRWTGEQQRVVAVTEGHGFGRRLAEHLAEAEVPHRIVPDEGAEPEPGIVHIATGRLPRGVVVPGADLVVITETDLVGNTGAGAGGNTRDMRRMPSRRRGQVDPLSLRPGDHVVHEQHGVGKFVEMMQRTVQGATREYVVIEYASSKRGQPGDRLFVPTDQLDQITRYVGGEAPSLNKLGGADWQKTKSRARKHVRQIAGELIRLYSARMATEGHAFGPDSPWQRELEDAFAHVETADQLSSIDEVKEDMEKTVPMDRLICGDVGYGKTEIAVRAAFKAVQDGKQVAVLVPTTLLVQQHFQTFSERYAQFPVTVKALSRFQSAKEAQAVIDGLADGSVDLVIGTHALLTSKVRFKDLGLVVIDEEQRFGVEHKEQLK
ncbi:MAG: CarD family transcriptional regulator, partial [Mobilicoccus sp.]|nr:CarD family transcriptional regulator [Mobilicoccus sp.]